MDWLEQDLNRALERKDPPPDFTERVVAEARRGGVQAVAPRRAVFALPRWLPVAAAVLLIAGGGAAYRRHQQGVAAKERVMLAMRITAGKLNHIQTHVREAKP